MKKKNIIHFIFLIFLVVGTIYVIRNHQTNKLQHSEGNIFGTVFSIEYEYKTALDSAILEKLNEVDSSLSMFNKQSIVSKINSGESDSTDLMFRNVFRLAQNVAEDTDGAYDITVAPLVNAWGFGFKNGEDVSAQKIDSIKTFVGYKNVTLEGTKLKKADRRTMLDFSSVAKGYALDCIASLFDSLNIKNYLIMIGGEVVVKGIHPEGRPWKIGISRPTADMNTESQTALSISNIAMATSGNYLRYYEKNGKRYAHTIDPISGHPVQHDLLSATVFAPTCAQADAYATAFMVMGMERAKSILWKHPEMLAHFIYTNAQGDYEVWMSEKLKKHVVKTTEP